MRTAKSIPHSEHQHYLLLSKQPRQYRLSEIHRAARIMDVLNRAAHIMDGLNKPAEVLLHKRSLAQVELLLT